MFAWTESVRNRKKNTKKKHVLDKTIVLNTSTFFDLQEFRKDGSQEIRHMSFFPNSTLDFHLWSHREAYLKTESYPQLPAGSFITWGDSKCYVTVPSKKLTNRDWLEKLPHFQQ